MLRPALALIIAISSLGWAGAAAAQAISVEGTVTGTLTRGRTATFGITATHPDGWRALDTVSVVLSLRDVPLEELVYEVDLTSLSAGSATALVGTGDEVTGRFLRVSALDVRVTTSGTRLDLSFRARLLDDVPRGARFEFVAEDLEGGRASIGRVAAVPEEEDAFSWGPVIAGVVLALLAGGFLGSRLAPHRRSTRRSIYDDVARRILEERERDRPARSRRP
jgi:hypothetical protein